MISKMTDYTDLSMRELCDELCNNKNTLIVYHIRSDADAIGSAFALRDILVKMGSKAYCACSDKIPERLAFLSKDVQSGVDISDIPFEAERIISVDSASPSQLGGIYDSLSGKIDIMIDHHGLGTRYADGYIDPSASATGEIIFELAKALIEMGKLDKMTDSAVRCIYAAISSDTGCFRFSNATPKTYRIAAELLEMGAQAVDINHRLFESKTFAQIRAEGEAAKRLKTWKDGLVASVVFPYSTKKELDLVDENLETIIDIPRSLAGVEIAFAVRQPEDTGRFRVSMRSAGEWNVATVCAEFGGGGHKKAAGCSIEAENIEKAEKMVLDAIEKHLFKC